MVSSHFSRGPAIPWEALLEENSLGLPGQRQCLRDSRAPRQHHSCISAGLPQPASLARCHVAVFQMILQGLTSLNLGFCVGIK